MCKCTPNKRTPFCGRPGCEWPKQQTVQAIDCHGHVLWAEEPSGEDRMTGQEFLKRLLLKDDLVLIGCREIEGGLLLTMQDGSQWRVDAVCVSQAAQDETQADL